jgi:hypothetical protein
VLLRALGLILDWAGPLCRRIRYDHHVDLTAAGGDHLEVAPINCQLQGVRTGQQVQEQGRG